MNEKQKSEFVVATKKRYPLTASGKVDKDQKPKILRENIVIKRSDADHVNKKETKRNGLFYLIDEAKTNKYYKDSAELLQKREKEEELKKSITSVNLKNVAEALTDKEK